MSGPIAWFERKFDFTNIEGTFPGLYERLEGTPLRLSAKLGGLEEEQFINSIEGQWSIKEHVGHLSDLEPLWQGRIEDLLSNAETLRPADLQNRKTDEAHHNLRSIDELLSDFRCHDDLQV